MYKRQEFVISGIRLVAASRGVVIAADRLGKYKTVTQMIAILLLILGAGLGGAALIAGEILLWASVALSVASCASYIVKNSEVFKK